jgi:hypothetical protein
MYFINVWTEPTTPKKGPKRAQKKHRANPQRKGGGLVLCAKEKERVCLGAHADTARGPYGALRACFNAACGTQSR